jgi:hypothetical protein
MHENNKDALVRSGEGFAKKPLKDKIGENLRKIYDDVVNEDIPDDFLTLLQKADEKSE